jgi:hypothetical protein
LLAVAALCLPLVLVEALAVLLIEVRLAASVHLLVATPILAKILPVAPLLPDQILRIFIPELLLIQVLIEVRLIAAVEVVGAVVSVEIIPVNVVGVQVVPVDVVGVDVIPVDVVEVRVVVVAVVVIAPVGEGI